MLCLWQLWGAINPIRVWQLCLPIHPHYSCLGSSSLLTRLHRSFLPTAPLLSIHLAQLCQRNFAKPKVFPSKLPSPCGALHYPEATDSWPCQPREGAHCLGFLRAMTVFLLDPWHKSILQSPWTHSLLNAPCSPSSETHAWPLCLCFPDAFIPAHCKVSEVSCHRKPQCCPKLTSQSLRGELNAHRAFHSVFIFVGHPSSPMLFHCVLRQ